uniref:Uncharacterized protein n=1 Tax=Rhizophora mucronata TaxID=61149 RepID=A0A2P2P0Z4_RHIMU
MCRFIMANNKLAAVI